MSRRTRSTIAALACVAAALMLQPAAAHGEGAGRYGDGDTGVVNVSNTPGYAEAEQPLAINPADPNQIVIASSVFQRTFPGPMSPAPGGNGFMDTAVYSSRDGGRTWTGGRLDQGGLGRVHDPAPASLGFAPEFDDALNVISSDADAAWDRHGNAYYESGDIHGVNHNGDETGTVWRSTDAGLSWGPSVEAVKASEEQMELDRPWFAVDNSGGPRDGTVYFTFETTPFGPVPPEVYVKSSIDHGATWSATSRVDDGIYETQFNARQKPVVGADGTLYVVYDKASPLTTPWTSQGPIGLMLARSSDGAQTFERLPVDGDVHRIESPDEATPGYIEMISAIAADPTTPGRLAIAWPQAIDGQQSRIFLRVTNDGGTTWSDRIDVSDAVAGGVPNQHDHVSIAWTQDGRLVATWRDRRCCGGGWDASYQQWARIFTPGGSSLVPGRTIELTEGPRRCTTGYHGVLMPDEFQGLGSAGGFFVSSWSQLTGDLTDVVFRRVPLTAFD